MEINQMVGWIGMILMIAAYILVSQQFVSGHSKAFHFLNLFGAFCLAINAFFKKAWPIFSLESIWTMIALYTLLKK